MATKRHPGRPPLDATDPSVSVSLSIPSKKFDELCAQARRQEMSLPAILRQLIYSQTEKKPKK